MKRSDKEREGQFCSEEFIMAMSHDLRVPLAVVKESISLILDGIPGNINEKQEKMLIIARKNVDKIVVKMDALLEKAKEGGNPDGKKSA